MSKKKNLVWVLLYSSLVVLALLLFFFEASLPDFQLHASYLNVGHGNSTLIVTPQGKQVLIDGGPLSNITQVLPQKLSYFDHKIDLVVVTDTSSENVSGLLEVLKRYEVGRIIVPTMDSNGSRPYQALLKNNQSDNIILADKQHDWQIEKNVTLDILTSGMDGLVLRLNYGSTHLLFAGSSGSALEQQMLQAGRNVDSFVLQVAQHGASSATSKIFLEAISPKTAVISVGKNNPSRSPHFNLLKMLKEEDVQVYRTDDSGTIDMTCDAKNHCETSFERHPKEM